MSQLGKEKHQVAWFKLSEFIRRGEKERALGIYKLLMHTVDDSAFAKQLEGDLLLFFNDPNTAQSYLAAAQLYKKQHKLAQATAIYEHLVAQFPQNHAFLESLITCYLELNHPTRITLSFQRLINPLIQAQSLQTIIKAVDDISILLEKHERALLYSTLIIASVSHEKDEQEIIQPLIHKISKWLTPEERIEFYDKLRAHTNTYELKET